MLYMKERIVIEVTPQVKKELKEKADNLSLSMKDYLVLKGLEKLKESK